MCHYRRVYHGVDGYAIISEGIGADEGSVFTKETEALAARIPTPIGIPRNMCIGIMPSLSVGDSVWAVSLFWNPERRAN